MALAQNQSVSPALQYFTDVELKTQNGDAVRFYTDLLKDTADAIKHFEMSRNSSDVARADDVLSMSNGYGEMRFGEQKFGGKEQVSIKTKDANYLGQVTAQDVATRDGPQYGIIATANAGLVMGSVSKGSHFLDRVRFRYVQGGGELIGRLTPDGIEPAAEGRAFDEAELEPASGDTIALHLTAADTTRLDIGYALGVEPPGKVRVQLQPKGFYRHTFICGQSRSGKTFALGVMLERLLLADGAFRIIILDPNSDFVRIDKIRAKDQYDKTLVAPCSNEEYSAIKSQLSSSIRILRPHPFNPATLKIRLSDLDPGEQGAVVPDRGALHGGDPETGKLARRGSRRRQSSLARREGSVGDCRPKLPMESQGS